MLKRILIFTVLITAFSTSAYANGLKAVVNPDNGSVFGLGKGCKQKKGDVFVTVLYPGADVTDPTIDLNNISYIKTLDADAYGNFELAYTLNDIKPGTYQVSINDGCGYDGHQKSFLVATVSDVDAALTEFNGLLNSADKSISDYEAFIDANKSVFGINLDDEYAVCDKSTLWQMMKDKVPYSSNTDVFKRFYYIVEMMDIGTAGATEIADALGEYMLLADSESCELYEALDNDGLERLYSNVQKTPFNPATFGSDLKKMLIVETFNNTDRSVIKDNVEKYAAEIGIDITAGSDFSKLKDKSSVYIGMANNTSFGSFSDIKKTFDALVAASLNKESATIPQGGGSGSSGGGVSLVINTNENTPSQVSFSPFKDLDDAAWAKGAIEYLYSKKVINGVSETEFKPNNNVTREEFIKMLVVAFDVYDSSAYTTEFGDVDNNKWYASYVASGVKNGIVAGIGDGKFGVGNYISRQDMAVMLYRIIQNMNFDIQQSDALDFSDSGSFAPYSREAIEVLSAMGIVSGIEDGIFAPQDYLTRAMAAAVITRVINR